MLQHNYVIFTQKLGNKDRKPPIKTIDNNLGERIPRAQNVSPTRGHGSDIGLRGVFGCSEGVVFKWHGIA